MDWNIRPPPTSSFQTTTFQIQGPYPSQQFTAAGSFSQANASTQNSCTYLGNNQAINFQSSTNNIGTNKMPFQTVEASKNTQTVSPKTSVSNNGSVPTQHVLSVPPASLSSMVVQMAPGVPQNSSLTRNMHVSRSVVLQGNIVNPMENIPQTVNPYIAMNSYSNNPPQNCSNSTRTKIYQQANKNNLSPKRLRTLMPYYYVNGPATSQAGATVPLKSASGHYLNSQQSFSCFVFPLGNNIQNQINGPNSSLAAAMQSQNYASEHVNTSQYTIPTPNDSRNATEIFPQVTNTNCPPPYSVHPVQANHGHFVLPQPVANISNENVQIYQSTVSDQTSNSYFAQHGQKPQPVQIARESNEVGSSVYSVSGQRAENQLSNESAKSSVEVGESLVNSEQVARTVLPDEASTPQSNRTLEQEKILDNSSGTHPENPLKAKPKITRESLQLDLQKLRKVRSAFLKLEAHYAMKHKLYLSEVLNKKTSDVSIHNPNPNPTPPSCNTNQNQPLPLPHANQVPSYDAIPNQSFSSVPSGSSQNKGVPLLPQMTDHHLLPILRSMLQGTVDENMLSNTFFEKGNRQQNRHLDVQENSSSTPLVSSGGISQNHVNNIDRMSRQNPKASTIDPTQESLSRIKNDQGFQQTFSSANNQLEKNSPASGEYLFHHFRLNKDTIKRSNKIVTNNLPSSVQNPPASHGSFFSVKKALNVGMNHSALIQQSDNSCLQKSENHVTTGGSESVSDKTGYILSKTASILSKTAIAVKEAGTVQKTPLTGNSCKVERTCSLEELETSLALWGKCLPASLNGQLSESTKSTVSLSSDDGVDSKKAQQTLENIPNLLSQNDQNKVTIGSNETTQSYAPSSLGKNVDAVSSNLLKGSEPQVAIVTPLRLAKESTQDEVQKNSPSLKITYPIIEEGSVHSLGEINSTVPDTDKGADETVCSPSESSKYCKDLDKHQKAAKSMEENGILKAESETNYSYNLNQGKGSRSSLELKELKSQLSSEGNFPPDFSSPVIQKGVNFQTDPDMLEPGGTAEVIHNDTEFQISSVCTLVQGDAFYNSQIASIFSTSPLTSSLENGTSSEKHLQHNKQPDILRSESCNHSSDLINDNQEISAEKDLNNSSAADSTCTIKKESALEHIPTEENPETESNFETPVTLLDDQLTELSKEFPFGIGDLNALKELESQDSIAKPTEREDKRNTKTCGKNPDSSDAGDQLKIIILNPQQMKEVFPEHDQRPPNKPENHEDNQLITDSLDNLTREFISHIKIEQATDVDRNIPAETPVKKRTNEYCCLDGWLALSYPVEPCSCMPAKEDTSKQKVDLCSESQTMFKDRPEPCNNFKANCVLNSQLQMPTLHPFSNNSSGDESTKKFNKNKETNLQVNKNKPSKVDKEAVPLPFLEKQDSRKAERTNEVIKELPSHGGSIILKTEPVEIIEIHDHAHTREYFSTDQTHCPSSTEDLKMVVARNLDKMESSNKLGTPRLVKSKTDALRHRRIEIKHNTNCERYKIKRDSSETHMIKGPTSRKYFKKQKTMGRKLKTLGIQHSDATNASNISSVGLVSGRYENSPHTSALHSQGHLNGKKWGEIKDLEKKYAYRKREHNESTCSERTQLNSEHTQLNSERTQHSIKRINLEKYAYSKERKNAWKPRTYLDNNKTLTPQKQRRHPNISKTFSPGKEAVLDAHNRDKWSERSLSDKKACFNRKTNKLSISLQREQKKNYLNRVAFKRTAQKTICLTSIDSSHSKSVWHVKSSSVSGLPEDQKKSNTLSQQPNAEKPQMLEFKMCPEILFRNSDSEEQILDTKELPEKNRTPITAVKSKREDWLNYMPEKRRKTEETEGQVDYDIPLDTAIKLLDGNDALHKPVKDSTFQTYRKLHLEKRSRSLDSSPLN
ncbi:retroelement silencing factor 1 [Elgaria multicarinata webbii]|uniref:retroelement silencing factor 1 n=1 Tax=Elgaria multicarinata webbii TaxID=159646 RepID=UPI002FCD5B62